MTKLFLIALFVIVAAYSSDAVASAANGGIVKSVSFDEIGSDDLNTVPPHYTKRWGYPILPPLYIYIEKKTEDLSVLKTSQSANKEMDDAQGDCIEESGDVYGCIDAVVSFIYIKEN